MKALIASLLLLHVLSAGASADPVQTGGGMAIGDLWLASAAEHQAGAEAILERLQARNIHDANLAGSMMADFLRMFSGGGGAPLDLVSPRAGSLDSE